MEQMAEESAQMMLELLNRGKKTRQQSPKRVSFDTIPMLKGSEKRGR